MRRIVWGVVGLVALVLLLVAGAVGWLTSPAGERWTLGKAVTVANEQLSGKLEAGSVELSLSGLTLRDVKLYTPEGELVAEVARVEARLSLTPLAAQHVVLTSARLERPRLYLVQDERGLNLSRALEPRQPKPEEPDTGPGSLRLTLDDFQLEDGYVDFVGDTEEGTRQVRLEDFDASGGASYGAAKQTFNVHLEATGGLSRPLTGPVKLSLRSGGEEQNLSADVELTVAGLELQGRGGMRGLSEAWLELKRLSIDPATARAVVPSWPLLVPVSVEGNAQKQGDVARVGLDVKAGSATVDLDGSFNLATLRSDGVTLKARDINLAELMENAATTAIVASLTARGGGKSLETLDGEVELTVSPSKFKGQPLGPVELRASAKDGRYQLSRLLVLVPGASLDARGQGTVDRIQVKGSLSASDLAVLGQTVGRLGPGPALPLSGSGALDFELEGPLRTPGVELSGSFSSLAYADNQIKGLSLKAALPDVTRPLSLDASLVMDELRTSGRILQSLSAAITTRNRALEANVRTAGDVVMSLSLAGTVDEDQEGLAVSAMTLAWPEAMWTLQGSSHVGFGGGRLEVKPALTLTSDTQRLALTLVKEGERVDGLVQAEALDLTKLPRAFVPESLGLGGTVSARVSARGRLPRPDAELSVTLEGGRFQQYTDIGASLKGTYLKDRATGTLTASVPAATVSADFDVPVQGVLRRRKEELSLRVNLSRLSIEEVRKLLGRPEPVSGDITGVLEVTGPARDPRFTFTLRGEKLSYEGLPAGVLDAPLGFTLSAASDATDGTLDARLDVTGLGREAYVALQTPFTLGGVMTQPPTADEVLRAPISVEGGVTELPFFLIANADQLQPAKAATAGQSPEAVKAAPVARPLRKAGGTVSAKFALSGSVLVPEGKLEVQGRRVTMNELPPLDAQLSMAGGGDDIRAEVTALRYEGDKAAPLAELSARLEAPLGAMQDPDVIGWVPFELKARLHPTHLKELLGLAQADPALREQGLQGILGLELAARGTPASPELVVDVGAQQLGVGKLALGQAHFHYTYADARSDLNATVTAPTGGTLLLRAGVPLELSLPAVQQGLKPQSAPLDVKVVARGFDMAFLSGAHEMVRSLGGVLEADASIAGTAGAPTLKGNVSWKNGRLGLMGLGEYRDIQVALEVTEERLQLQELFARGGSGELRLTAEAVRSKSGAFELTGQGQLKDFPIISEDQLVAVASLRATLEGSLSLDTVNIRELSIPEAHIELPEVQRKDLQPLERAPDIVLVRDGVPVEKRRRKRAPPATTATNTAPGNGAAAAVAPGDAAFAPKAPPAGPGSTGTGGAGDPPPPEDSVETEEEEEVQRTYRVLVNAPRNLWVRGSDVNIELGLSKGFEISYTDELYLSGEVIVQRGRVSALGRRFDVEENSRVIFTGPPLAPYLNLTAQHVNERENVTVFVHIRGQGKEFTIEPTSDPAMSETEIYTLLATGRRTLERNSGASMTGSQAASVVGSLVASQAQKALAAELPLDVLSIEAGEEGLTGAQLEVGKYLTDKIYVGYTGRVGSTGSTVQDRENANAVRFEYQFSPQWSLEANYGDARSGGLDLIWSKDY
ncbi:translocation/assembly module TamB domain-containing protein [Hyalangium sp.]|uniref:translocation/assembly module TamB domain-containing protein n=1 Tax=Hyalangium sp. TaxID=2028555 RepID=UPI002D288955|nr:translocation/assembly module TamB domain-containing protein [Hyalangium sp.]HYH95441.1 translocation/assembly module TamB domain-containing protein [Hyalangium sp.]